MTRRTALTGPDQHASAYVTTAGRLIDEVLTAQADRELADQARAATVRLVLSCGAPAAWSCWLIGSSEPQLLGRRAPHAACSAIEELLLMNARQLLRACLRELPDRGPRLARAVDGQARAGARA
jgi:hypothetical protein